MTGNPMDQALMRAADTIRSLRSRVAELEQSRSGPAEAIAVVSATCRLPGGANSPEEYWDLLEAGRNAVRPLKGDRWQSIDFSALDDPAFARLEQFAGQLDQVDGFDAEFFGMADAEADLMDPQQRILLEIAWEATERAGWTLEELGRTPTGVFVGVGHQDYMLASLAAGSGIGSRLSTGSGARSLLANRISYEYGLQGPSLTVDTACSSSLVAIHLACQSLRSGECDRALAGGVNLILSPLSTTMTGRALPLAPDGRTKALAADADGMVRGEGAGLVALKRLSDALADNDPIEAVILADGINQDGRTNGLTAPSPLAQQALLARTLKASGLRPDDVTFVEMHGTGTPLGDPIEYEAIRSVYGSGGAAAPTCWLGSVKANLGHLESAAGVASLIKVLGALRHGRIPKQINLGELSPFIELEGERFSVPRELVEWRAAEQRCAAVSSFGFGGTNAHLIIAHPETVPAYRAVTSVDQDGTQASGGAVVIPLSARSGPALAAQIHRFAEHLEGMESQEIRGAVAAVARGRAPHPWRTAVVAARPEEIPQALRAAANSPGTAAGARDGGPGRLAFVFSGQAAQWPGMGLALAAHDSVVRDELMAWDETVAKAGGPPLLKTLAGRECGEALRDTRFAQLAIAALQSALFERLRSWGLAPAAVCGHSVGEVSAALAAGALTRTQAVAILLTRAQALHQHAANGAMYAIRASEEDVAAILTTLREAGDPRATRIGIAALNGPQGTVLSGPAQDMESIREHLTAWRVTPLVTKYAFHSPGLAPVADHLLDSLADLRPQSARLTVYSTVTGTAIAGEALTAQHWADNAARQVRFSQAVGAMLRDGITGFVELGPHPALLPHLQNALDAHGVPGFAVGTLRRRQDEPLSLLTAVGRLWSVGCTVDWDAVYPGAFRMAALPTYPWQRRRHWLTAAAGASRTDRTPEADTGLDEEVVLQRLISYLSEFMGTDAGVLDPDRSARDLDVDSVSIVELKNRLESELGTAIPITVLTEGATLRDIARTLTTTKSKRGPTAEEARRALENLDDLSEEELDQLLTALDSEDGR